MPAVYSAFCKKKKKKKRFSSTIKNWIRLNLFEHLFYIRYCLGDRGALLILPVLSEFLLYARYSARWWPARRWASYIAGRTMWSPALDKGLCAVGAVSPPSLVTSPTLPATLLVIVFYAESPAFKESTVNCGSQILSQRHPPWERHPRGQRERGCSKLTEWGRVMFVKSLWRETWAEP